MLDRPVFVEDADDIVRGLDGREPPFGRSQGSNALGGVLDTGGEELMSDRVVAFAKVAGRARRNRLVRDLVVVLFGNEDKWWFGEPGADAIQHVETTEDGRVLATDDIVERRITALNSVKCGPWVRLGMDCKALVLMFQVCREAATAADVENGDRHRFRE